MRDRCCGPLEEIPAAAAELVQLRPAGVKADRHALGVMPVGG